MVIISKCQVTVITLETTPPTENQTPQQSNVSTNQSSNDETSQIARLELNLVLIIYLQSFLISKMFLLKIYK